MTDWAAFYNSPAWTPQDVARDILRVLMSRFRDAGDLNEERALAAIRHGYDHTWLASGNGQTLLIAATLFGTESIVAAMIEAGADVNARKNNGDTALILAAKSIYPERLALLARAGGDINHQDENGRTALYHAAIGGRPDMVFALLHNGVMKPDLKTLQQAPANMPYAMSEMIRPLLEEALEKQRALDEAEQKHKDHLVAGLPVKTPIKSRIPLKYKKHS